MTSVPGVCPEKIPSFKWWISQISVASLSIALALAASSVLAGRLEAQSNRLATNELPYLSNEHRGLAGGPEDATHLLQAVSPRVERGTEGKVSSDPQDRAIAHVNSSSNLLESIQLAESAIASVWISFMDRTTLGTLNLLRGGDLLTCMILSVVFVCFVGILLTYGVKESLQDPSQLSAPLSEPCNDVPASDMKQKHVIFSPSTPSVSNLDLHTLTQSPSPNPVPGLLTSRTLPRFPPHLGIPLRQVTPFDVNANQELTIVNLTKGEAGFRTPAMWVRVANNVNQRMLQLFTDPARKDPRLKIVSIPRRGALEIISGGISYGFLEAENSGKCYIMHNGENVLVVEGEGSKRVPEIAVRSKTQQVAGLRSNQALDEPYMEFGISPGEDAMLIVAVVIAVMLLAPSTWQPPPLRL